MLNQEEISHEILNEIGTYFKTISFENYGKPMTNEVQSRSLRYIRTVEENVEAMVLDPETLETKLAQGDIVESYIVRGIFKEDCVDVYMVQALGKVMRSRKECDL